MKVEQAREQKVEQASKATLNPKRPAKTDPKVKPKGKKQGAQPAKPPPKNTTKRERGTHDIKGNVAPSKLEQMLEHFLANNMRAHMQRDEGAPPATNRKVKREGQQQ